MLDSFDHIFWCGDFNYRVALTREQADQLLATSDFTVSKTDITYLISTKHVVICYPCVPIQTLLLKDQLTQEILHGMSTSRLSTYCTIHFSIR